MYSFEVLHRSDMHFDSLLGSIINNNVAFYQNFGHTRDNWYNGQSEKVQ